MEQPAGGGPIGQKERPRIALVVSAVKLAHEVEGLDRAAYIAGTLVRAGYDVDLITSRFQHWQKAFRDASDERYHSLPYRVVFLDEPGYRRNIELARIRSHRRFAENLRGYLERHAGEYDLFWAQIPPNNISADVARFARREGRPFVVDVNDLWPEAMRMVLNVPVVSKLLFHGFEVDARTTYRLATACVATSAEYAARPDADRDPSDPIDKTVVYVGGDMDRFDAGIAEHAGSIEKDPDEFWVTYAGTLGKSYDLATLIDAVELAAPRIEREDGRRARLLLLGDGPTRPALEEHAAAHPGARARFFGYVAYGEMAAWLSKSDVLVNSLIHGAPQSIVSKIGDYLAAGKPMVNTGESPEFTQKVTDDGFGVNVVPGDAEALADALVGLACDQERWQRMAARAREVAARDFDRKTSYVKIVRLVDRLTGTVREG